MRNYIKGKHMRTINKKKKKTIPWVSRVFFLSFWRYFFLRDNLVFNYFPWSLLVELHDQQKLFCKKIQYYWPISKNIAYKKIHYYWPISKYKVWGYTKDGLENFYLSFPWVVYNDFKVWHPYNKIFLNVSYII